VAVENSIFLEIAEIWGIENVYPNRESRWLSFLLQSFFGRFLVSEVFNSHRRLRSLRIAGADSSLSTAANCPRLSFSQVEQRERQDAIADAATKQSYGPTDIIRDCWQNPKGHREPPNAIGATLASPAMASVTTSPATQKRTMLLINCMRLAGCIMRQRRALRSITVENAILHQSTVGLGQSHLVSRDTSFRATRLAGLVSDSRSLLGALERKTPRVRSVLVADLRR
jgi:hypothetical protein